MMLGEYNPEELEEEMHEFWEENKVYAFDPESKKPVFSIDTPPPTFSGEIHVGHAMSYSQAEFIARYKRMKGYNVFYPMGFDDNGLPTERLVEKIHNVDIEEIGRGNFVDLCLRETKKGAKKYRRIWTKLGISVDWTLSYSTISDRCRQLAQLSFMDLYEKKRLKREKEPVIWCPECRTAIAQAELEDKEEDTLLSTIVFKTEDEKEIHIATTRPELLASCVAIAVHPHDERYTDLVGTYAVTPIFGNRVKILADRKVEKEFGTGIVMICTFGDKTDIEWWKDYNLDLIISINENGTLNEKAGKFEGMKLKEARKAILDELKSKNLLVKQKKLHHALNTHDKCGTPVEYLIKDQWFVKILDMKDTWIAQADKMNWYPAFMKKRYISWVENLKWDWCISRQRYYGVPFPVWYCKDCGRVLLPSGEELPVDPLTDTPPQCKCGCKEFIPEKDVMDTWFTSSLTPQIIARWDSEDSRMDTVYPNSLRPQAHDIIRTWLFYTVVKSYLHNDSIPWENIMLSGFGLDEEGKAMHKSVGNVIHPSEVVERHSADALRWWASSAKLGDDLPFNEKDILAGQRLCIKLWNASKLVASHLGKKVDSADLREIDRWILYKVSSLVEKVTDYLDEYEYSKAKKLIEASFWHDFCDNYLEIVKYRLYGGDKPAQHAVYNALLLYLKLFAIYIPHITEKIYQEVFREFEGDSSIHISSWPEKLDIEQTEPGETCVSIISALRKWKSGNGMALNAEIEEIAIFSSKNLDPISEDIKNTMNVRSLQLRKGTPDIEERIVKVVPNYKILGPKFGDRTKEIVGILQKPEIARRIETGEKVTEYELSSEHVLRVEKEYLAGGRKVELLTGENYLIEIF
ncbi:MAG: valine--tRNA ligase [Euryarchaeota archaeon]|nr:valine--tRNA ligase [Euryarchaeota archaeon]